MAFDALFITYALKSFLQAHYNKMNQERVYRVIKRLAPSDCQVQYEVRLVAYKIAQLHFSSHSIIFAMLNFTTNGSQLMFHFASAFCPLHNISCKKVQSA